MSDLISRKSISDYLKEQHAQVIVEKHKDGFITDDVCKGMECSIDAFVNFISQCPTVDAVPVVHGEWIRQKNSVGSWTHPTYKCSICGNCSNTDAKFCSECGSSMEQWVNGKSKWE